MTYKSSHELEGKTLCREDIVVLLDLRYTVKSKFLNVPCENNREIFNKLGIKDYRGFCSQHYGYDAASGDWPECQEWDYKALTRVVMALFKIIEEKEVKEDRDLFEAKEPEPKPKVYKSLAELEGNILKYGDLLVFDIPKYISILKYKVCRAHLGGVNCDNDLIFIRTKIKDAKDFCTKCYGYKATDAMFPYCKCDDYIALTKVAKELFKLCEASQPVCSKSTEKLIDELNEDLNDLLGNTAKDTIVDKSEFTFTHVKPIKIKF